jgi:hypothetical protein
VKNNGPGQFMLKISQHYNLFFSAKQIVTQPSPYLNPSLDKTGKNALNNIAHRISQWNFLQFIKLANIIAEPK